MKIPTSSQSAQKTRRFVMRPYRRIPTCCLSYYMSGDFVGKGVVTNLSCAGMRVHGEHAMKPGTDLAVRLTLEEGRPPLEIERVTVQWVNESEFGLKIVTINPTAAKRITHLLAAQARVGRWDL
jgi:hypothetical protein